MISDLGNEEKKRKERKEKIPSQAFEKVYKGKKNFIIF
jgi:hypothetical protein